MIIYIVIIIFVRYAIAKSVIGPTTQAVQSCHKDSEVEQRGNRVVEAAGATFWNSVTAASN